jgi:amidohydrolase
MIRKAQEMEQQLIRWRRDLHRHPELSFQETHTAAMVADEMRAMGYRVRTQVGRTGVVADLGRGEPVIGIRADMDALPIQETNTELYVSQVPGVMHACGHDAHVACALGAARLLHQEDLAGAIRFLFQPAEEAEDDEGLTGAPRMIQSGAMEGVSGVIALHVDPAIPVGAIGLLAGPAMAGIDTLNATILGQGGHGARPEAAVDPVYIASHVVLALYGIVARRVPAIRPAVISIGSIHGGQVSNVIPEKVELSATIRYMDSATRQLLHHEIERVLDIARSMGGDCHYQIITVGPPTSNDPAVINLIGKVTADLLGPDHALQIEPLMGSEDFCFFSDLVPGAMFRLGCKIEGDERQHHNPRFDVDERCLSIGAAMLAETALRLLRDTSWLRGDPAHA